MHQEDLSTLADSGNVAIHGGFPNPALDRIGQGSKLALDLNAALIKHPSSTYLFRVRGHSSEPDGIFDGDLALIDRSLLPRTDDLVLVWQASGFVLCHYNRMDPHDTFWGVISSTIHERRQHL
ncbi:MAG: S24 family peptidase [Patescibacteria group bacterium]|nr:S24 family peptidase [Patescibacteria group bacterium]